ncbi:hypothetical protein WJX74_006535 [Apatococcus lobatus]|uniref:Flavodoxin-like domain-containing protein n=1 Tax=Apatococcus lobatus TaxID=904363 RepID=A0AAW1RLW5_9CHLO
MYHELLSITKVHLLQGQPFAEFGSASKLATGEVGKFFVQELGTEAPEDIGDVDLSTLTSFDGLVVGAPTWNTGADEQRSGTAWDDVLTNIAGLDLNGKPVAVYGLGDSVGYGDYYCDAMEEIYSNFSKAGAKMIGHWPADGYQHAESKAILGDGKFCGLALDQDNEDDLTEERVKTWAKQLKGEGL